MSHEITHTHTHTHIYHNRWICRGHTTWPHPQLIWILWISACGGLVYSAAVHNVETLHHRTVNAVLLKCLCCAQKLNTQVLHRQKSRGFKSGERGGRSVSSTDPSVTIDIWHCLCVRVLHSFNSSSPIHMVSFWSYLWRTIRAWLWYVYQISWRIYTVMPWKKIYTFNPCSVYCGLILYITIHYSLIRYDILWSLCFQNAADLATSCVVRIYALCITRRVVITPGGRVARQRGLLLYLCSI
jgi:hypothetical protein